MASGAYTAAHCLPAVAGGNQERGSYLLIDALFAGGLDAFKTADFEASVEYFKELLGLQPTSARTRTEFVRVLIAHGGNSLSKGNLPAAISAYTEAVKLSPDSFHAVFGLAKAFWSKGEICKALEAAAAAVRVEPGNPEIHSFLQELQRR